MSTGTSALGQVGAVCFGVTVGYITYRRLVRTTGKAAISDLAAVAGAIGGAAVTGLFAPGTDVFAWYSIGLLVGMALFFVIFGRLNGLQHLATILNVTTEVLSVSNSGTRGPTRPQASPETEEVS
jgi:hypothetical protein